MKQNTNRFASLSLDDDSESEKTATPPPPPPDPSVPPANGCPMMTLPTELRLEIFGMALRARAPVVNVGDLRPHKKGRLFNVALLRKNNIVRVKSLNDPYTTRKDVRHLELVGDVAKRISTWGVSSTNVTANTVSQFSKIKTFTISIDCMYDGEQRPRRVSSPPQLGAADRKAHSAGGGQRMIEYGLWQVWRRTKSKVKFFAKRFRLSDAVSFAKALDPSLTLVGLHGRMVEAKLYSREHAFLKFAVWVAALELMRKEFAGKAVDEDEQGIVDNYVPMRPEERSFLEERLKPIPADSRLLDLTVQEHGEAVLRRAESMVGAVDLEWRA